MDQSTSRKRPWLAALLATIGAGLGHLYLRRWQRALGWLAVLFVVTVLFVDVTVLKGFINGTSLNPASVTPILIVLGLSVIDAYLIGHTQNATTRLIVSPDGQLTHCPNCGEDLDPELEFCHWCTTKFEDFRVVAPEEELRRDDL